jgi:hypothetical protein
METKKEGLVNRTLDYLNLKLVNIENNIDQYQMSPRDKTKAEILRRTFLEPCLYMGLSMVDHSEMLSGCLNISKVEVTQMLEELAAENRISIVFQNPKNPYGGKRLIYPPKERSKK